MWLRETVVKIPIFYSIHPPLHYRFFFLFSIVCIFTVKAQLLAFIFWHLCFWGITDSGHYLGEQTPQGAECVSWGFLEICPEVPCFSILSSSHLNTELWWFLVLLKKKKAEAQIKTTPSSPVLWKMMNVSGKRYRDLIQTRVSNMNSRSMNWSVKF